MSYQGSAPIYGQSQAIISNEIRQEILRFESVHPSIYAIYDLIDGITDPNLKDQIRDHVVSIEDSFVNSQEWTSSRYVPDIKLGIVGFVNSGKSALVHRYLTGSYMHEESPEGGRFKKEVQIDGQSYLLLIRDEGGNPEAQFTNWVDAVILVFSLENEMSFNAIHSYYKKMCHYRDISQMPIILVGTQDAICENNPRVIEDARAKKLEAELGTKCRYYETCATYGLNVEHVFQDACQKAANERSKLLTGVTTRMNGSAGRSHSNCSSGYANPRLMFQQPAPRSADSTPVSTRSDTPPASHPGSLLRDHSTNGVHRHDRQQRTGSTTSSGYGNSTTGRQSQMSPPTSRGHTHQQQQQLPAHQQQQQPPPQQYSPQERQEQFNELRQTLEEAKIGLQQVTGGESHYYATQQGPELTPVVKRRGKKLSSAALRKSNSFHGVLDKRQTTPNSTPLLSRKNTKKSNTVIAPVYEHSGSGRDSGTDLPTPNSTPTQARKSRRRSNLFNGNPKKDDGRGDELGSGRAIPVKQGFLYKKGSKGITKDWKKKYVTLTENGKLIYHSNIHDYMENSHGKEISLIHTTVKIPGQPKPRLGSQLSNGSAESSTANSPRSHGSKTNVNNGEPATSVISKTTSAMMMPVMNFFNGFDDNPHTVAGVQAAKIESNTPHVKRRHRRARSGSKIEPNGDGNDSDGYEFLLVSLDNKQWHFEAPTSEDRDIWVGSIEKQIFQSLQGNDSLKKAYQDPNAAQAIRNTPGNHVCCDCDSQKPQWASLNLGTLICIECSGIHRNLGTHLSRVRSLELDEWPPDLTAVMLAIGNLRSNSVWEAKVKTSKHKKPSPSSTRDEKEAWIRAKYEQKLFLPPRSHRQIPLSHLLIDAIARQELTQVISLLADSTPEDVSFHYSNNDRRTPLHIAAQQGNAIFLQLLLWYGADVTRVDQEGRSALWYARQVGSKDCAAILQANGCTDTTTLPRLRRE